MSTASRLNSMIVTCKNNKTNNNYERIYKKTQRTRSKRDRRLTTNLYFDKDYVRNTRLAQELRSRRQARKGSLSACEKRRSRVVRGVEQGREEARLLRAVLLQREEKGNRALSPRVSLGTLNAQPCGCGKERRERFVVAGGRKKRGGCCEG